MKFRNLAVAALAVCLPLAATACGGSDDNNSGDRPSEKEIATALSKELPSSTPDGFSDCVAKEVHGSDIPNGVLRAIVAGEEAEVDKDNEDKYTKILADAGSTCATEAVGGAGATPTTAAG